MKTKLIIYFRNMSHRPYTDVSRSDLRFKRDQLFNHSLFSFMTFLQIDNLVPSSTLFSRLPNCSPTLPFNIKWWAFAIGSPRLSANVVKRILHVSRAEKHASHNIHRRFPIRHSSSIRSRKSISILLFLSHLMIL